MSDAVAIKITGVSKSFKLPHEQPSGIKQSLVNIFKGKKGYEVQHVLDDISFEINKGDFFGILGRNGSGKSTLLKVLSGIYEPDQGAVHVNGTLTPFIELGVGFNPELTGRENIFLNGALLGFSTAEMNGMYDEIVGFAELENFMDQKLKNYSSGMQVRLAFSIAIRANTDILVLDEVLAVGDERFQNKCIETFEQLKKAGKTIVLVTHDMNSVRRFCNKAVVIHDSELVFEGSAIESAHEYARLNFPETITENPDTERPDDIEIKSIQVNGKKTKELLFTTGDTVSFGITWRDTSTAKNVGVAIIADTGQYVYGTNTIIDGSQIKKNRVKYEATLNLGTGGYHVQVGIFGELDSEKVYYREEALTFRMVNDEEWQGTTKLNHKWITD